MSKGLTSQQIKAIDEYTIDDIGLPSMVLMERAALAITQKLLESDRKSEFSYDIVCGMGNNGADGLAIGRLLHQAGRTVTLYLVGDIDKASAEFKRQIFIVQNLAVPIFSFDEVHGAYNADVILDALFGIGLNRNVEEPNKTAIEKINQSDGRIIAVDVPSGLSADTGRPMGTAVEADITYTIGFNKIGFEQEASAGYVGALFILDIGYPNARLLQHIIQGGKE